MIEDKLSRDERLRLECLAQAIAKHQMKPPVTAGVIIRDAQQFEVYVRDGKSVADDKNAR